MAVQGSPEPGNGRKQDEDPGGETERYERFVGAPPVSFGKVVLVRLLGKERNGKDQRDQADDRREGDEVSLSLFHTVFLVHWCEHEVLNRFSYQS